MLSPLSTTSPGSATMVAIKNATRTLCTTPMCLQLAGDFVKNLSPNYKKIDPCANFEEMVCGGWRLRHEIPATQTAIETIRVMEEESAGVLRAIVEGPYPGDSVHSLVDQDNFETMQLAYNTCMDENELKKLGVAPITNLLDELRRTFGGDDWSQPLLFTSHIGTNSLVLMYVASDLDSPDVQLVHLNPGAGFSLPNQDLYTNTSMLMDEYAPIVASILQAVHGNGSATANFTEQARQLVKFEADLAAINPPRSTSFYELATKASFPEADTLAPRLGLTKVYAALAPPSIPPGPGNLLWDKAYTGNLNQLLETTPRSAIEGYFTWRVILATQSLVLADEIFQPFTTLRNRLQGVTTADPEPSPRWRTCLASIRSNLGWVLSRFFTERSFTQRDLDLSNQIISDVRAAYVQKFHTLPWLDDPTRAKAMEKINLLIQKIGYPTSNPNLTDPESLRAHYSGQSTTASHFSNGRSAQAQALRRNFQLLGKPTDRTNWGDFYSVTVNAYYAPDTNEIAFPAGILQLPVFGGDLPSAVNYGAFGAVAGHEVSHGFDRTGRNFDGTGRLVDWWSEEVLVEYKKREQCFVEQFGNMTVYANDRNASGKGYKVDGLRTLGENEADSAGIVAAYDAWLLRRELDGDKEGGLALPGLEEWTDEQLFFLAFDNVWCGLISDDGLKLHLQQAGRAPNWGRIMGSTANSRAFKEAFACGAKEPTCELW